MARKIRTLTDRIFHRSKTPTNPSPSAPESPAIVQSSTIKPEEPSPVEDLWQSAYNRLDSKEQNILSTVPGPAQLKSTRIGHSSTTAIIDAVIQTTREQYEKYQGKALRIQRSSGEDIDLRSLSHRIINSALSFKSVIDAVVTIDPTQYAASAWTIVSLGLTMSKNRLDLRDALFDSSEFLADILAKHAYIERNFYHGAGRKPEIGQAVVRVYTAVLRYTAEVLSSQNSGVGRWLRESVTEINNQPLTELKACVKEEELNLHQWIQLDQLLQHGEEAEKMLEKIDKMSESLQSLIKNFGLPIAEGAAYDSYVNQHEDLCLPGTRVELCSQILDWAESSSESKCVFWLKGMAGTGKSTIARTVAQAFKDRGLLGASFFFKRNEADRCNAKKLIPTVVKQLITTNHQLAPGVLEAIQKDPDISTKALSQQFETLLLQPLINLRLDEPTFKLIVIDALDECEQDDDIRLLLHLLPQVQVSKFLRLRVFITSRPELPVRLSFQHIQDYDDLELQELPKSMIEHDIRLFLQQQLEYIQREHSLPPGWPGKDTLDVLVSRSVPLFIFAATLCRFIGEKYQVPEERLDAILKDPAYMSNSHMDGMYLSLLNKLLKEAGTSSFAKELLDVLEVIILLATPLSVRALAHLVNIPERTVYARLTAFYSVLRVPSGYDTPVRILHSSFSEFLLNTTSVFHVDERQAQRRVASHCLRVMSSGLKHNICGLSSYGTQSKELDSQVLDKCLPAEMQYSCRYWVYHFERCRDRVHAETEVLPFLKRHFLHWVEAMSLLGLISEVVSMINKLQSIAGSNSCPELSSFLHDAKHFILRNIHICSDFPLQIYCSGLAFSPNGSILKKLFHENQRWMHIIPRTTNSQGTIPQAPGDDTGLIRSVVPSSEDNTTKVWDYSDSIVSVSFSPDGQMVASGSKDNTIKLWDIERRQQLHIMRGHSDSVASVAFSPDGQMIISGSYDNTIKIWDINTGEQLHTIEGHSDSVVSVSLSPNGQMIASGSDDKTVRLYDIDTRQQLHIMEGHSDWVQSVAFSPDSQLVASGSYDNTIRLWDANTGQLLRTLEAHSSLVASVVFSPDGETVVSGSYDNTIRLWNTQTGQQLHTMEGHSGFVRSVAFSPDGQVVASGSYDSTIRLWDAKTSQQLRILEGHSSPVRSVTFSPNGHIVASGSYDNTIKLWDAVNGQLLYTLGGGSGSAQPVASSPEGQMANSSSPLSVQNGWVTFAGEKTGGCALWSFVRLPSSQFTPLVLQSIIKKFPHTWPFPYTFTMIATIAFVACYARNEHAVA